MSLVDLRGAKTVTELAEVLYVSDLSRQPAPNAGEVAAAVSRVLAEHDIAWCVCQIAQDAGDHPDCYQARMRWALELARNTCRTS